MTKREIAVGMAVLIMSCASAAPAHADAHAEVLAGVAAATGLATHRAPDAERVQTGPVGTTIVIEGLFGIAGRFSYSPSFCYLSTNGDIKGDPAPPHDFDIRFQQSELGIDLLWQPGDSRRFRIGPGVSAAWWSAVESRDLRPYYYETDEIPARVVRSQCAMLRGVAHLMLRDPDVTGVSIKLIAALPMADLLKANDTAATGYVALHVGLSMPLN